MVLSLRRILTVAAVMFVTFSSVGFGPPALIESSEARTPLFPYQIDLVREVTEVPNTSALSAAIIDGATGKVLYGKNAEDRLAPASVTKIMTAILALENGNVNDYVQVTVNGWTMAGSSIMGLRPGEVLSLQDLLYGLMLPSGNDAALAIAQHIGGTEARFVQMMNQKATELGLKNTHFANPHGLDEGDHFSSAHDLAMLGRYAMQNPTFAKIVGTTTYVAKGKMTYTLQNGNRLIGQYEGADGVKTGYTENAGQSFVASVKRNGQRVFVSVIRSIDRYRDARLLFDYSFRNFVWLKFALPNSPFFALPASDGGLRKLRVGDDRAEPLARWQTSYLRSFVTLEEKDSSQVQEATEVGVLSGSGAFYLGTELLGVVPVQ